MIMYPRLAQNSQFSQGWTQNYNSSVLHNTWDPRYTFPRWHWYFYILSIKHRCPFLGLSVQYPRPCIEKQEHAIYQISEVFIKRQFLDPEQVMRELFSENIDLQTWRYVATQKAWGFHSLIKLTMVPSHRASVFTHVYMLGACMVVGQRSISSLFMYYPCFIDKIYKLELGV